MITIGDYYALADSIQAAGAYAFFVYFVLFLILVTMARTI